MKLASQAHAALCAREHVHEQGRRGTLNFWRELLSVQKLLGVCSVGARLAALSALGAAHMLLCLTYPHPLCTVSKARMTARQRLLR